MDERAPKSASIWRRHLPDWVGVVPGIIAISGLAIVAILGGDLETRVWAAAFWSVIAAIVAAILAGGRLRRRLRGPRPVRAWSPEEWRAHDGKRARRLLSRIAVAAAFFAAYPASAGPAAYAYGRGWIPSPHRIYLPYQAMNTRPGQAYARYYSWWLSLGCEHARRPTAAASSLPGPISN